MARQFFVALALSSMAVVCAIAGSTLANWVTTWSRRPSPAVVAPLTVAIEVPAPAGQRDFLLDKTNAGDNPPPVDLYGNEVSDAVAKYRLKPGGDTYEERSPQVKLPRLAAPKS